MRRHHIIQLPHLSDRDAVHVSFTVQRPGPSPCQNPGSIPVENKVPLLRLIRTVRNALSAAYRCIWPPLARELLVREVGVEVNLLGIAGNLSARPVLVRTVGRADGL